MSVSFIFRLSVLDEEQKRRVIFHNNIDFVFHHKLKTFRTFKIELNHLADLTADEFKNYKKGFIPSKNSHKRRFESYKGEEDVDEFLRRLTKLDERHHQRHGKNSGGKRGNSNLPSSFDWRDQNAVGSIKDQGNCGACYAFATSAVMESLYAVQNNAQSVIDLSPQQIVDCGENGCNGGSFAPAVDYLNQQGGQQATLDSYPYVGIQQSCTTDDLSYSQLGNIQYTGIPSGDETSLAADVVSYGPIFVGVDASSQYFQFYNSGILSTANCSNLIDNLDHAVVVVGYGYDATLQQSYWIIKNFWSTTWGENGYIRLAKDAGNMCGVGTDAYYAQLS